MKKKMRYKKFVGAYEYDRDAKIYHGEVINIRDVITFQSRNIDNMYNEFKKSVDVYLHFTSRRKGAN